MDDDDRGTRERSRSRDRNAEERSDNEQNATTNEQQRNLYVTSLSFQVWFRISTFLINPNNLNSLTNQLVNTFLSFLPQSNVHFFSNSISDNHKSTTQKLSKSQKYRHQFKTLYPLITKLPTHSLHSTQCTPIRTDYR